MSVDILFALRFLLIPWFGLGIDIVVFPLRRIFVSKNITCSSRMLYLLAKTLDINQIRSGYQVQKEYHATLVM